MKNFATSLVVTPPSPVTSGLSLTVSAGTGTLFQPGRAILWPNGTPTASTAEIVQISNVVGDTLTLSGRAQESTTARSVAGGWSISQGVTASEFTDVQATTANVSSLVSGLAAIATDSQYGVKGDGVTDDRPAIQALLNAAAAAGVPEVYFPPGNYLLASVTTSTGANGSTPNVPATLTSALLVPPGVSVRGAGSGRTRFTPTVNCNAFMIRTAFTTNEATITANSAQGATTFTVDSTTGFTAGDLVATRVTQNASDPAEARWTVFATVVSVNSATSITLDTPAEYAMDTTTSLAVNRKFIKVSQVAEKMRLSGFHIQGNTNTRHGIGVFWARHLRFDDITGYDVGSGLINAQWVDNGRATDIYVFRCGAYGNTSKGRAISLSNVTNFTIENFSTDYLDAASIYIESYSRDVRVNGFRINNRSTTRAVNYLVFSGVGCEMFINGFTLTSWAAGNTAANQDSVVSFGPSDGRIQFHNVTLNMQLNQIRQFPFWATTGLFRVFDNSGVLRTFNMNKVERSNVAITLTDGATKTAWLRDGLVLGYEAAVPLGITSAQLTTFTVARVGIGSLNIPWVAGQNVRVDTWIGDGIYPLYSKWDQSFRIQAIVAASAGVTGQVLNVTAYTVVPDGYATVLAEPGSAQQGRFGTTYTV